MRSDFLREDFKPEDPVRKTAGAKQAKRLARILNDLQGVGCRIEKPKNAEGYGWRVIIDGSSDIPLPYGLNPNSTDTDGYAPTKNPDGRQTVQHNPESYVGDADNHANEIQLHNVHTVKDGSGSIPVFFSETPLQGHTPDKVVGELYWATPDADRKADDAEKVYRSLDVADTHVTGIKGKYQMSLYGFTASGISQVPYTKEVTNPSGSGRELEWRWPVRCFVGAAQDPCNTVAVQNKVVARMASTLLTPTGTHATLSFWNRNLTVSKGSLEIEGEDSTQLFIYLPVTIDPDDIPWEDMPPQVHTDLDFSISTEGKAATNADHDQQYLQRDGTYNAGKTFTNTCGSIASNAAGANAISFTVGKLYDASTIASVDYAGRKLLSSSAGTLLEWGGASVDVGVLGVASVSHNLLAGYNYSTATPDYSSEHKFYGKFEVNTGGYGGTQQSAARFWAGSGADRVVLMDTSSGLADRTLIANAVDGSAQIIADGTHKTVTITNLRLDAGGGNFIAFTATNGQLLIVDQSGNQLGLLAKEEPA